MNDRELLELAAKAAGIEHVTPMMIEFGQWDPLTDDGDALRLAVKLDLQVLFGVASRRAIVRAAAEIGKAMP